MKTRLPFVLALWTFSLSAFAVAPSPAKPAPVQTTLLTETIHFTYASPNEFLPVVAGLQPGISRIDVNESSGYITVQGTAIQIEKAREIAQLLDVPARRVRLRLRLLRFHRADFSNRGVAEVVALGTLDARNNNSAELTLLGAGRLFLATLIAHVNGDESVSLLSSLTPGKMTPAMLSGRDKSKENGNLPQNDGTDEVRRTTSIVKMGEARLLAVMTGSKDPKVRSVVRYTRLEHLPVPGTPEDDTYYLEVTAQPLQPQSPRR